MPFTTAVKPKRTFTDFARVSFEENIEGDPLLAPRQVKRYSPAYDSLKGLQGISALEKATLVKQTKHAKLLGLPSFPRFSRQKQREIFKEIVRDLSEMPADGCDLHPNPDVWRRWMHHPRFTPRIVPQLREVAWDAQRMTPVLRTAKHILPMTIPRLLNSWHVAPPLEPGHLSVVQIPDLSHPTTIDPPGTWWAEGQVPYTLAQALPQLAAATSFFDRHLRGAEYVWLIGR